MTDLDQPNGRRDGCIFSRALATRQSDIENFLLGTSASSLNMF